VTRRHRGCEPLFLWGGLRRPFKATLACQPRFEHAGAAAPRIDLTDPMSGHFMIRRDAPETIAPSLSTQGFKILLDILETARGSLRTIELPSTLRERQHGESKLDSKIALDFAALVAAKLTNDAVSARFLLFCLVGLTGIGIHLSILSALLLTSLSFGALRRWRLSAPSPGISCSTICLPTATSA
jgi:hypothetical protein